MNKECYVRAKEMQARNTQKTIDQIDINIEFCSEVLKSIRFGKVLGHKKQENRFSPSKSETNAFLNQSPSRISRLDSDVAKVSDLQREKEKAYKLVREISESVPAEKYLQFKPSGEVFISN